MQTLKPCPFCDGDAELDYQQACCAFPSGKHENRVAIYCTKCDADMGMCYSDFPEYDYDQMATILAEKWNTRPAVPSELQHTICASCLVDKPTPLRRGEMGGYVCLTCVDQRLDSYAALNELCQLTFAIQHNPNCPHKFLIRLPGKSGLIDLKPYRDQLGTRPHETGDILGFGKTLHDAFVAVRAALEAKP